MYPVEKTDDEWQAVLSPAQFKVLREQGTEQAHTGKYTDCTDKGVYHCIACDAPLYLSDTKVVSENRVARPSLSLSYRF